MFTKKEKTFLLKLIDQDFTLQALDYNFDDGNEKEFRKEHGLSFKQAEKMLKNIIAKIEA